MRASVKAVCALRTSSCVPVPASLRARARRDAAGQDESAYLAPLEAIAAGAPTQAEYWLARFHGPWSGDLREIFAEASI